MNDRSHFDSLFPAVPFSRRGFLVSSVASGFALAVQPVMAQNVIMTDTKGLDTGEAFIPVQGATMSGYFARPAGAKNLPTILVSAGTLRCERDLVGPRALEPRRARGGCRCRQVSVGGPRERQPQARHRTGGRCCHVSR